MKFLDRIIDYYKKDIYLYHQRDNLLSLFQQFGSHQYLPDRLLNHFHPIQYLLLLIIIRNYFAKKKNHFENFIHLLESYQKNEKEPLRKILKTRIKLETSFKKTEDASNKVNTTRQALVDLVDKIESIKSNIDDVEHKLSKRTLVNTGDIV